MSVSKAEPGKTRVGWIGTGVMGRWMCQHLMDKGYKATVYNRSKDKAKPLLDAGAAWADSPKQVAENADAIFAIVGFPPDVREVFLGEKGALAGAKKGAVLIDMTTSEPSLAVEIYEAAKKKGVASVDAPVSGGDVGAKNAALSIMVGGDTDVVEAIKPLFECMGKAIIHQGGAGTGQHTKMVNQILIASNMIGVCEALLYGYKAGLDLKTVLQAVGGGAAGSWSLNNLGPRILDRNFEPGFFVEHFIKDMRIALSEAERMNLALPGLALAKQLYEAVRAQGYGRKGTHALMLALEHLSNVKR
ncbi:MAG: NAD(P)-dependent oxidoreductase [Planctomycetes bacterium]|nr:NAD(P)-dependent oxidoreductase [Planctomycetota bacterium]